MNSFSLICISIQLGLLLFIWVSLFFVRKENERLEMLITELQHRAESFLYERENSKQGKQ